MLHKQKQQQQQQRHILHFLRQKSVSRREKEKERKYLAAIDYCRGHAYQGKVRGWQRRTRRCSSSSSNSQTGRLLINFDWPPSRRGYSHTQAQAHWHTTWRIGSVHRIRGVTHQQQHQHQPPTPLESKCTGRERCKEEMFYSLQQSITTSEVEIGSYWVKCRGRIREGESGRNEMKWKKWKLTIGKNANWQWHLARKRSGALPISSIAIWQLMASWKKTIGHKLLSSAVLKMRTEQWTKAGNENENEKEKRRKRKRKRKRKRRTCFRVSKHL